MPASRPRAVFQPISPDFDLNQLVETTDNFKYVDRISVDQIDEQGVAAFEKLVLMHVIVGGKPLIVDGFEGRLDPWTFTPKWLRDNVGEKVEQARNLTSKDFLPLTISHYLKNMSLLTNQYFANDNNYKDKSRQRIYLKDIDCPQVWHDKLQEHIPAFLYYLNDSTGDVGGPGSSLDPNASVPGRRLGRGIARAGDLMSSLPTEMRAENMMCYIGHEGTYTPSHREMCASMGHNIMVEASSEMSEDGKPEKPGSSVWFMTESKDRQTVSEYWLSVLGHDIEVENHFAQVSAWKTAPFNVYVVEQRPGDFILIPPLAPHQVWNRGTRTMKVAWNRTTLETLEMALDEALPKARIVCRDEQYKNKAIVYYTLSKYSELLASAKAQADKLPPDAGHAVLYKGKVRQLLRDFKRLFKLYKDILLSEMFLSDGPQEKCEYLPFDSNVTCAYCRGNIFNRFLSCPTCKDALGLGADEPYDVCMECYAMGRSCSCISGLKWQEQFKWKELTQKYDMWRKQIIELDRGTTDSTPSTLIEERAKYSKKTLAEVCREQLRRRPFKDPHKPPEPEEDVSDEEIVVDDEGRVKKTVKKRSKTWLKNNHPCHVCQTRHPDWKMAKCTNCERWWCFGSLFRGHDNMPLQIMEDPNWWCAHCESFCFAGACRKDPRQKPYQPKGTLLGHDTKKVADARSIEALVDFSVSNLNWIKDGEHANESAQMRRARDEAQRAKDADPVVIDDDDHSVADDEVDTTQIDYEYSPDRTNGGATDAFIDPALRDQSAMLNSLSHAGNGASRSAARQASGKANRSKSPIDGHPEAVFDGYIPATTGGFVAPSAVMIHDADEDGFRYPDPTETGLDAQDGDGDGQSSRYRPFGKPFSKSKKASGKRARRSEGDDEISMAAPKRRRVTEDAANVFNARPRNEATAQYQKEKERKALDEAKRRGHFIAVQAALRGRKKFVTLKVCGSRLGQLGAQLAARQALMPQAQMELDGDEDEAEETVLLRSDVAPRATSRAKSKAPPIPNKMKVRVEKDDDFGTRRDRRPAAEGKKKVRPQYEEVDIMSEDDGEDSDLAQIGATRRIGDGGRGISAYLAAKHQDDINLPEELPKNYRDVNPRDRRRSRLSNGTADVRPGATTSAKARKVRFANGAGKRPAMRPPAKNSHARPSDAITIEDDNDDDDDDGDEDKDDDDEGVDAHLAKSAEDNRLVKLQMLQMLQDEFADEFSDEDAVSPAPSPPPVVRKSIFDSRRKGGKAIKIVSAAAVAAAAKERA